MLGGRAARAEDVPPASLYARHEALRLHPPAYILLRHVRDNDVVAGHRVYKGGAVVMTPLLLHRHPDYWERPDEFWPERWLDAEAEKRRPKLAFIPFSAGPRQCIGNNFSLLESTLILATLAQRFAPRLVQPGVPPPQHLVLCRPAGEVTALLERRSQKSAKPADHSAPNLLWP